MKKFLALLLTLTFVAGVSASAIAAPKKKVVKKKVAKKKVVKPVKKPVKPAPVTPWVPPAPAPVAPAPAPAPAPAAGMGISLGAGVGVKAGLTAISGNLDYSTAGILAGSKIRIGGDYLTGTNGVDSNLKVVTLKVDGIYALDMLKQPGLPVDFYVGGGALYAVKVSGGRSGSYGLEAFVGANYKIPDFGCLNAEVGYAALKYGSAAAGAAKGVEASVGYSYAF